MRKLIEVGEHSVWAPGLLAGGFIVDGGANHGRFSVEVMQKFSARTLAIEANPALAGILRGEGLKVAECALGAVTGSATFHVGENDEASSVRIPTSKGAHLSVKESVVVAVMTLPEILEQEQVAGITLVKLDIEGAEVEVLPAIAPLAQKISPQWTVEFHDDPEFALCTREEVNAAIRAMAEAGFSVLIRCWPSRTNVLFVNRRHLRINSWVWFWVKFRYQWLAWLWRKFRGI